MCAVEPIPLRLETMKDPKLVSVVSEARKGQGLHNYIKGVCIHSPASIFSVMRQIFPYTVLKLTVVNYVLEDNPEFKFRTLDYAGLELNIILKDSNVTVDYKSTYKLDPVSAHLKANKKFPLKKGDYIIASVSFKMVDQTPCEDLRTCTSIGALQFEFNGVPLPGDIRVAFMNLNTLFRYTEIYGLGGRTSARELHWLYNTITEGISLKDVEVLNKVEYLQLRAKSNYLWAGDWAVLTGRFKNRTARYQGIVIGVTKNYVGDDDLQDFVRYRDYAGAVTFHVSVGVNATIINTEEEIRICAKITAGDKCLIPTIHNIELDNVETHVMTWPNDQW